MFARSSTIHADTSKIDEGIAYVQGTVMPQLSHMDGYVGMSLIVDRSSGRCIATTGWRGEQDMRDSAVRVVPIRDSAADAFGGAAFDVEEWEVVVMHRAHHARPGTCMRVTWGTVDPSGIDKAIDHWTFDTLGKIEDLPGFCSASLMLNETSGRMVVTVAYDTRTDLERTRSAGAALRDEASAAMMLRIDDVAEFDLALAHLHIPELV